MLSDADLMRQVQAGRHALFTELVRRHRDGLLRFARSKLADAHSAEDAVQEALLSAYAARSTFDPRFAFSTWVYSILLNVCRRQRARTRRRRCGRLDALVCGAGREECRTPLDELLESEDRARLSAWLGELPEAEADALRLRFFAGFSFDEIALAMQSSLSAAKSRVRRGLERLAARRRGRCVRSPVVEPGSVREYPSGAGPRRSRSDTP